MFFKITHHRTSLPLCDILLIVLIILHCKKQRTINLFYLIYYNILLFLTKRQPQAVLQHLEIAFSHFKNFTTNKIEEVESFVKTIYDVKVKKSKEKIEIQFYGSGFLRYQVRMMVGALIVVSTKKKDISFISHLLKENVDEKCSYKADPQGLYLKKVIY